MDGSVLRATALYTAGSWNTRARTTRRANIVKLTDKEQKLILLAFDLAAGSGGCTNAFRALMVSWLKRFPDGHQLVADLKGSGGERIFFREKVVYRGNPFADYVLGFGKHRGNPLREIPVSYLQWVVRHFDDLWPDTRQAMESCLRL